MEQQPPSGSGESPHAQLARHIDNHEQNRPYPFRPSAERVYQLVAGLPAAVYLRRGKAYLGHQGYLVVGPVVDLDGYPGEPPG